MMRRILVTMAGACALAQAPPEEALIFGQASRGGQVLRARGCTQCHAEGGGAGRASPDLARRFSRRYTPVALAAVLWNHGRPDWDPEGRPAGLAASAPVTEQEVADLFAWFAARRYFERTGDAARGKRLFQQKGCGECHGIARSPRPDAPAVAAWRVLRDPAAFALAMWNRPPRMAAAFSRTGVRCPPISGSEMTDLLIYLENLSPVRRKPPAFAISGFAAGETAFRAVGCGACHSGKNRLENRFAYLTPSDVAAALWNHGRNAGAAHTPATYGQMAAILTYVWMSSAAGDARRGEALFRKKACAQCHGDAPPAIDAAPGSCGGHPAIGFTAALLNRRAAMQAGISASRLRWPKLGRTDMEDLVAYFQSGSGSPLREAAGPAKPPGMTASRRAP